MSGYITIFMIFVEGLFDSKEALHMFQQNRYRLDRFYFWIKKYYLDKHFYLKMLYAFIWLVICVFFNIPNMFYLECFMIIALVISFVLRYQEEKKKQYVKPLVYTARVKRQIISLVFIQVLLLLFVQHIPMMEVFIYLIYGPLCFVLVSIVGIINEPIEILVRKHFYNEAKHIISNRPNLIKIGITGSYGKTSSKNVVQALLSQHYYSLMTPASFNTPMGITITVREKLEPLHEVFVCEMGADHVGDIKELMEFIQPQYGLLTTIGPQHLQTFKTQENIIKEKFEVIEKLPQNGIGFINIDNAFIQNYQIKNTCKIITFSLEKEADYQAFDFAFHKNGSSFKVRVLNQEVHEIHTKLLGKHNISNILAAIAIAHQLNIPMEKIVQSIPYIPQVEHRLEIKKINGLTFIDNAFNSNPSGAKMSLEVIKEMDNKRFIITPGLIDLGQKEKEYNYLLGTQMKDHVDVVILVGKKQTEAIYEGLQSVQFDLQNIVVVDSVKQAFDFIYQNATQDDIILLENDLPDAFSS